ncbi:neutral/alkaline non-lysosomal ceramidase N-terminal domain-containing protein [bacterium]|nr:neutral/alkaline non-lysosomal ceramidase N-terminal domain-containing protein [bacterium]
MPQLLAGAAATDITPTAPVYLAGFASRDRPSEGVHDPLHARAVVFQSGDTTAAIVSCDLIGLTAASIAAIRSRVGQATGIPAAHVMVACTHTHSGPTMGVLRHPGLDADLVRATEAKIADAVVAAHRALRPAAIGCGLGHARISINRRQHQRHCLTGLAHKNDGPCDDAVLVVRVDDTEHGAPLARLVGHACHPVVLAGSSYPISADFPGQVAAAIEAQRPSAPCAVLNGACGDINPEIVGGTFRDAQRLGRTVARAALGVDATLRLRPDAPVAIAQETVQAPLAPLPPRADIQHLLERRHEELDARLARGTLSRERYENDYELAWARDALAEHRRGARVTTRPIEVHALRLGDALLVGLPGEVFVQIGQAVRAASPLPCTFVVGYANGNVGYLPTAQAFPEGGYEVDGAPRFYYGIYGFAPGIEAALMAAAASAVQRLATATG